MLVELPIRIRVRGLLDPPAEAVVLILGPGRGLAVILLDLHEPIPGIVDVEDSEVGRKTASFPNADPECRVNNEKPGLATFLAGSESPPCSVECALTSWHS